MKAAGLTALVAASLLGLAGCTTPYASESASSQPPWIGLSDHNPCFDDVCFVGKAAYQDWVDGDASSPFMMLQWDPGQHVNAAFTHDVLVLEVGGKRDGMDRSSLYAWKLRTGDIMTIFDDPLVEVDNFVVSGDRIAISVERARGQPEDDNPTHDNIYLLDLTTERLVKLHVGDACWKSLNSFSGDVITFTRYFCGGHKMQTVAYNLESGEVEPVGDNPWSLPQDGVTSRLGEADGWRYFVQRPDNHPTTPSTIKRMEAQSGAVQTVASNITWRPLKVLDLPGRPDLLLTGYTDYRGSREDFVMVTEPPEFAFARIDAPSPVPDARGFFFKPRDPLYSPVPLYHYDIDRQEKTQVLSDRWAVGEFRTRDGWSFAPLIPSHYDHWGHDDPLIGYYVWKHDI